VEKNSEKTQKLRVILSLITLKQTFELFWPKFGTLHINSVPLTYQPVLP